MLANLVSRRTVQDPGWGAWARGGDRPFTGGSAAGFVVNDTNAMQLITVFGCTNFIANSVSLLPACVYTESADGATRELTPPTWVDQPTPDISGSEFRNQIVVSLLLDGNFYAIPVRNSMGRVLEVWPLHPHDVTLMRQPSSRPVYYVLGQPVAADNILHVRGMTFPGELVGMSPVTYCRNAIGTGLALEEFAGRWFSQGSAPSGMIETPGVLTETQTGMLREQFEAFHRGVAKSHGVAVLSGGATYKPITISPEDSQFLQSRNFSAAQIASCLYQVEPEMVGASMTGRTSLTYKNLEQRWTDIVRRTLWPWTSRIEEAYTRKLLPQPWRFKLDTDEYQRADMGERFTAYQTAVTTGWLQNAEVREWEDLPPLPQPVVEPAESPPLAQVVPMPAIATPPVSSTGT